MKAITKLFSLLVLLALAFSILGATSAQAVAPAARLNALGTWAARADMPTPRGHLEVVTASNGKLYAIGGYNTGYLATVEEYNPATDTWTARASMPTARGDFGVAVASNGKIYAIGGFNNGVYLATVDEYNPATDTWTARANMPTPRNGLVAVASNGKIYAIGGLIGDSTYTTKVEEYDPATDSWATRASMLMARAAFGAVTDSNGKIYAIGGGNATELFGAVEEYDPATDTWTTRANIPTPRVDLAVAIASNGKIYVVGGADGSGYLATLEEYDPTADTWTALANMPTPRSGLGAAVANYGKIYAIGGYDYSGVFATVEEFTPPYFTISGNAEIAGATLSYTDGIAKTTTADSTGMYSFTVPENWSGTVTPSKTGFTFTPASRTYTNVLADQTAQDYTAFCGCTNVMVNDDVGGAGQGAPNIIADSNGNLYLAWLDYRDGGQYGIYFAKSTNKGQTWSANVKVNTGVAASVNWPNLVIDGSGNLYLTWGDSRNGSSDIYFAKSTDGGTTWSANAKISDDSGSVDAWSPSLAIDSSGNLYVAWTDNRSGYWDNYFSKSINGGVSWSASVKVNDDVSSTTDGRFQTLAVDNSGNLHFVFYTGNGGKDLYSSKSTDGGATWSASVRINDVAGQVGLSSAPGLAVDGSGNLYAIWNDNRNVAWDQGQIYFSKSTDGGATWSANVNVSNNPTGTSTVYAMGLVVDSNGALSAVWGDNRAGGWDVYSDWSTDSGANWSAPAMVNDVSTSNQYQATLAIDGNDNLYAAWADQRNGDHDIYFSQWNNQCPSRVISGNAGIAGATLSYTDGTARTATADGTGAYSFMVPYNWSGTVTPSKTDYTFSPSSRSYTNATTDQVNQDYTATMISPACQTLNARDFDGILVTSSSTDMWQWFTWADLPASPEVETYAEANTVFTSVRTDIYPEVSIQAGVPATHDYRVWVYQAGNEGDRSLDTTVGTDTPVRTDGTTYFWADVGTHTVSADTVIKVKAVGAFAEHGQGVLERRGGFSTVFLTLDLSTTPPVFTPDGQSTNPCSGTLSISGNAGVAGATLSYTDGTPKTATADGSGLYSFSIPSGWSGTVTPSLAGYTFDPPSRDYSNVTTDQTAQDYTATAFTYTISGNAGVAGAAITYTSGSTTADGLGDYSFTVSYNWSGTVTPSLTGYTFDPPSRDYTNVKTDQTAQDYTATAITYTISGNAGVGGAKLNYTDGTSQTATADLAGNYSLKVSYNWSGTVTPSKANYTFSPPDRTYTNVLDNIPGEDYTVTSIVYTGKYYSTAKNDGWVLESNERSNKGGSFDAIGQYFELGDDALNRQYKAILSFNLKLPAGTIIKSAVLKIRSSGKPVGSNPFTVLDKLLVDVRKGAFGMPNLEASDFQMIASAKNAGTFGKIPVAGWYKATLSPAGISKITLNGLTQFRLYFSKDDNNDFGADYLKFFSGNSVTGKPELIITYTVP